MPPTSLLRNRDFRHLFVADVFGQTSARIAHVALPLVAIFTLDLGELQVGLLTAATTAGFLMVGLPAGAWVDRIRQRNVLITADVCRGLVLGSVPLAWAIGVLSVWQLYLVALGTSVLTVFYDVARQSYLPRLVGRERLVEGNTKLEAVQATSHLGGPAAAGYLVQLLTAPFAILANVVTLGVSAFFICLIGKREAPRKRRPDAHLGREVMEGLRFLLRSAPLRSVAASAAWFNLFFAMVAAMQPVFLARTIGLSPTNIGLFLSIGALGGLIGAVLAVPMVRFLGHGPAVWISTAATAPLGLLLPVAQPGWSTWLAAAGLATVSTGMVVFNVTAVTLRQSLSPDRLLGRVNATTRFLVWGTMPVGGLLGGLLGQWQGARAAIWIGSVACCVAFLPALLSPLRRMRVLPDIDEHGEELGRSRADRRSRAG